MSTGETQTLHNALHAYAHAYACRVSKVTVELGAGWGRTGPSCGLQGAESLETHPHPHPSYPLPRCRLGRFDPPLLCS